MMVGLEISTFDKTKVKLGSTVLKLDGKYLIGLSLILDITSRLNAIVQLQINAMVQVRIEG